MKQHRITPQVERVLAEHPRSTTFEIGHLITGRLTTPEVDTAVCDALHELAREGKVRFEYGEDFGKEGGVYTLVEDSNGQV